MLYYLKCFNNLIISNITRLIFCFDITIALITFVNMKLDYNGKQ